MTNEKLGNMFMGKKQQPNKKVVVARCKQIWTGGRGQMAGTHKCLHYYDLSLVILKVLKALFSIHKTSPRIVYILSY